MWMISDKFEITGMFKDRKLNILALSETKFNQHGVQKYQGNRVIVSKVSEM